MAGWFQNTNPNSYVIDIQDELAKLPTSKCSPSSFIIDVLKKLDSRIKTKQFRSKVLDVIYSDGLASQFFDQDHLSRLVSRSNRRFGHKRTRQLLINRCDVLQTWKYRDARFIPDAYLIDEEQKTVVCYEVEDSHPLNIYSIGEYTAAWWNLEYIYWDLHLIAYDVFGNHRVIGFPTSETVAMGLREKRRSLENARAAAI
jgi:hypothetical protein